MFVMKMCTLFVNCIVWTFLSVLCCRFYFYLSLKEIAVYVCNHFIFCTFWNNKKHYRIISGMLGKCLLTGLFQDFVISEYTFAWFHLLKLWKYSYQQAMSRWHITNMVTLHASLTTVLSELNCLTLLFYFNWINFNLKEVAHTCVFGASRLYCDETHHCWC